MLDALKAQFLDAGMLQEKASWYLWAEGLKRKKQQEEARRDLANVEKRLLQIEAGVQRLVSFLENGTMARDAIESRLEELATERAALRRRKEMVKSLDRRIEDPREGARIRAGLRNPVESTKGLPTGHRKPYMVQPKGRLVALMLGYDDAQQIESTEAIVRETGGPCADSDDARKPARWCRLETTPPCRPMDT